MQATDQWAIGSVEPVCQQSWSRPNLGLHEFERNDDSFRHSRFYDTVDIDLGWFSNKYQWPDTIRSGAHTVDSASS